MHPGQGRAQAVVRSAGTPGGARRGNALERHLLHPHVRRHRRKAGALVTRRMQQRDRAAVAVAHQHRPLDAQRRAQRRQHRERFVVQVVGAARRGQRIGLTVAAARVDQPGRAQPLAQRPRKVAPGRHRAEAFVQEHQGRAARRRRDAQQFEPRAGGFDELDHGAGPTGMALQCRQVRRPRVGPARQARATRRRASQPAAWTIASSIRSSARSPSLRTCTCTCMPR